MAGKDSVGQIIKPCVAIVTFIALTGGFRVITTALDDLCGLTRGAFNAVWPAQFTNGPITLHIIDEILDVDLHRWTPIRGWNMGWRQCIPSSNSTTLESNKSVKSFQRASSVEKPWPGGEKRRDERAAHHVEL